MPFVHDEVFKKAFLAGAEAMFASFPNKEKHFEQVSKLLLSADICAHRCEGLSGNC